jgi:hypothetical protein
MTTNAASDRIPVQTRRRSAGQHNVSALVILARRRLALSASNPREIFVPLLTRYCSHWSSRRLWRRWYAARPDWTTDLLAIGTAGLPARVCLPASA